MRFRKLGVLLASGALILGLATPAAAEQALFFDDSFDVAVGIGAPVQPLDISMIEVDYTTQQLTVTARFGLGLGETLDGKWTTAQLRLETTGDKKFDYLLMARHVNHLTDFAKPPKPPIATFFFGPNNKDLGRSSNHTKKDAGKFAFAMEKGAARTMTFTVPAKAIGKPKQLRLSLWVDLTDGSYARMLGLDTYPNVKSGKALGWSKPIKISKAATPTVTLTKKSVKQGKAVTATIAVKPKVAGIASVYGENIPGMQVQVAKGKAAKVTIPGKVTKKLKPGTYQLWVAFTPRSSKFAEATSTPVTFTIT